MIVWWTLLLKEQTNKGAGIKAWQASAFFKRYIWWWEGLKQTYIFRFIIRPLEKNMVSLLIPYDFKMDSAVRLLSNRRNMGNQISIEAKDSWWGGGV